MSLWFLHGLDSSPRGTKGRLLASRYPECIMPELPPDPAARLEVVERSVREPVVLIGTSLGGATALAYSMKHPDMVRGLVLMAPAVTFGERGESGSPWGDRPRRAYVPAGIPAVVIGGRRDTLVPPALLRALRERSPEPWNILVLEVDDDHDLHEHLELMIDAVERVRAGM